MTIKELRESKGLSQGKFAESIGIGRTAIVGYEKGKYKPSAEVAAKIKEVYGVDVTIPSDEAAASVEAPPAPVDEKPMKRTRKKKDETAPVEETRPVKSTRKKKAAPAVETPPAPVVEEKIVASAIKALRTAQHLSQKAFAESIGVKLPTVGAYEQGRIKPSEAVLASIKKVYGEDALNAAATPVVEEQPAVEALAPKKRGKKKAVAPVAEQPVAVDAAPAAREKKPAKRGKKKEAAAPAAPAMGEERPRGRRKVAAVEEKKPEIVIQSPLGGSITPEEILKKTGHVDCVYVRVDENKAYWVRGNETGSVDLW